MRVVKMIQSRAKDRRVEWFQRDDETFGFEELKWLDDERCWVPLGKQGVHAVDSMQHALDEAWERIPWLKEYTRQ